LVQDTWPNWPAPLAIEVKLCSIPLRVDETLHPRDNVIAPSHAAKIEGSGAAHF
jgi:hypothetical protein